MNFREHEKATKEHREKYVDGIVKLVEERQKEAEKARLEYMKNVFSDMEKYRKDFRKMLGWPLSGYKAQGIPFVEMQLLSEEDGYNIYRMQIEVVEGLVMTGLLFRDTDNVKKPFVIVQHGGLGTPELISGVYGFTTNYNDMLMRVKEKGVNVFAPQLLLWEDKYEVAFDRNSLDARLKRVGSSITALEVFGFVRIMDYFEKQDYVSNFGMVGLSYGGFYTLFAAAADTRIKSAITCSHFNKRDCHAWCDWTWFSSAYKFDDAEIACLVYPRKLHIAMGDKDQLFDYKHTVESYEKIKEICKEVGTDWVCLDIFDGVHEFFTYDEPIQKLVNDIMK